MVTRPNPPNPEDKARWELTSQRERMLCGDWYADLNEELTQFFAPEVLQRITHPDTTRNPQKSYNVQKNVLYSEPPSVSVEGKPDTSALTPAELWPLRKRGHLLTLGLRESLMRLDHYPATGMSYRVVSPAWVCAWATTERPDMPVVVIEQSVRRAAGQTQDWWTWETWDVRDPKNPIRKIERDDPDTPGGRLDVTTLFEGSTAYPYIRKDGTGILPWVLYHAEVTDQLWNWREQRELVDGTLKVGALWTIWFHGCRDCTHPQRVSIDMDAPQATTTGGTNPVDRIALDQSAILMLNSKSGRNGSITTLAPAMDPKAFADAIMQYEAGLAQEAGISPADLQVGGASGASGYAIVVSRAGLRQSQRDQIPAAAMGDALLLATAAAMVNAYGSPPAPLPEDPKAYGITYADVGRSLEEIKAEMEHSDALIEAGLAGPIDAIQRVYPQLTREGAIAKLVDIRRQQAEIDAAMAAAGLVAAATTNAPKLPVTPTDIAGIVTVDEVRAGEGLPAATEGGGLTVTQYQAKHAGLLATVAAAQSGETAPTPEE